jgi:hypothetical protein
MGGHVARLARQEDSSFLKKRSKNFCQCVWQRVSLGARMLNATENFFGSFFQKRKPCFFAMMSGTS